MGYKSWDSGMEVASFNKELGDSLQVFIHSMPKTAQFRALRIPADKGLQGPGSPDGDGRTSFPPEILFAEKIMCRVYLDC